MIIHQLIKSNMKKEVFYKITFDNTVQVYNEDGLRNFVGVAVINNKDISKFSVERITEKELHDLQNSHDEEEESTKKEESTCEKVEELLRETIARAARIVVLTNEIGPTVDGVNIIANIEKALKLLGYEQES